MLSVRKVSDVVAPSTCNCLLPVYTTTHESSLAFIAGCYELLSSSQESIAAGYRGCVTGYACEVDTEGRSLLCEIDLASNNISTTNLPGIFDITAFHDGCRMMASCTDGSVRLFGLQEKSFKEDIFPIHNTMLTSCAPFYSSENGTSQSKWLCTAHQGDVVLYDPNTRVVISTLEKHDYDAWCSATMGPETALTGGDDGLLKWRDVRCDVKSVGRMEFTAGVVSIAPVVEGGVATFYSLVGSYNENLFLVDSRSQKEPVASIDLAGGVWRCSRQLSSNGLTPESEAAMHYYKWVQPSNELVVPVMQRGVAFVRYNIAECEEKIFSLLGHLHGEMDTAEVTRLPPNALFYDCAVLRRTSPSGGELPKDTTAVVACDFYNKKIELWEVSGIDSFA